MSLQKSSKQFDSDQVLLKALSLFTDAEQTIKNFLLLSDLQGRGILDYPKNKSVQLHIVNQKPENTNNVYIDSLYLGNSDGNQIPLNIRVVGLTEGQTLPLSVFNKKRLIAKTAVKGTTQNATEITISLQTNEMIQGRVYIEDFLFH